MKHRRKKDLNSEEKPAPPPIGQFPWLVYDHSKRHPNQTFYSLKPGAPPIDIHCRRISALKNKKVISCSYGFLVLYDYVNKVPSLFNCTTFDTTPLPKLYLKPTSTIDSCVLSSSPNSPNCKVLVFLENCQSIMCCRIGSDGWTEIRYRNQLRGAIMLLGPRQFGPWPRRRVIEDYEEESIPYLCFCSPVICRGRIYANLKFRNHRHPHLWSIEVVDKEGEVELMLSRLDSSRLEDEFVVESDGEICGVRVRLGSGAGVGLGRITEDRDIVAVEMRKLSRDGMDWERVDGLKNRSIFICQDYSVSCPTPGHDCVFFTMARDLSLYTYNLEEDSLSVSLPFGAESGPIENHPFWMIPEVLIRQEEDHFNEAQIVARSLDSEKEDDEEKTLLKDLPLDALNEVAKLLTPHDYLNFRSLSRTCRSATPFINWGNRIGHESFPLLMFTVKCSSLYRFVHPLQKRAQCYLMFVPDCLKDAKVHYSNHGWLLMAARRSGIMHFFMYNPFTKDIRSYVGPGDEPKLLFFTSKPSTSTCVLIQIKNHNAYIRISASTPYPWVDGVIAHGRLYVAGNSPSPLLFRKAFYFLRENGELTRFYVEENNIIIRYEDRYMPTAPCTTCQQNFLVECGGDLLAIFVGHMGKWIRAYKLNESKWEAVTSLKGYALYLSQASSFSEMASPGTDNRIYFTRFRDGGALYYALDRGEWKFFGSEETLCDFSDTELQLHSCWIKPSWS